MAKRVLIFHTSGGRGHISAAKAIEQALAAKYPQVEVKNVNIIDYAPVAYRKVFDDGYSYITNNHPKLWGWFFDKMDRELNRKLPILLSKLAIEKKFNRLILDYRPDFIIATHPLPIWLINAAKDQKLPPIKSSIVVTDFNCHRVWVDQTVDYYFVASQKVFETLKNYGVAANRIVTTGIPIELKFTATASPDILIKQLNLEVGVPTFLIVGGMLNFSSVKKVVQGMREKNQNIQFVIIAGRDKKLKKDLLESSLSRDPRVKVFGFIDNIQDFMATADLAFSKAGGLTVAECMSQGLPMVFNQVIPGQEEGNVSYLVEAGAASKANDLEGVIVAASEILSDQKKLAAMKEACRKIGKPQAALTLADFVQSIIGRQT